MNIDIYSNIKAYILRETDRCIPPYNLAEYYRNQLVSVQDHSIFTSSDKHKCALDVIINNIIHDVLDLESHDALNALIRASA